MHTRPILALVPRRSAVEQILESAGVAHVCIYADDATETVDRKLLDFLRTPATPTPCSAWFHDNFNATYHEEQLAAIISAVE